PVGEPLNWNDRVRETLSRYQESLLREVAGRLVRPRNQWPVDDLISRFLDTLDNPAVLDRRLGDLSLEARRLLALIGHSRQSEWALGNLIEMIMALDHEDGLAAVTSLLEAGLLFPVFDLTTTTSRKIQLASFAQWLGNAGTIPLTVFSPPQVARRAIGVDLGLPDLSPSENDQASSMVARPLEADGLEWLLRLGVLWQRVGSASLRRTLQGGLFKRDADRLSQDSLLNSTPAERLVDVPDLAFWLFVMADLGGILQEADGELKAIALPTSWEEGLWPALESLFANLFRVRTWNPLDGWRGGEEILGNPFGSAFLLLLLLLSRLPEDQWIAPADLEAWLHKNHPYWTGESLRPSRRQPWVETFLLGLAYPMRVLQARKDSEDKYLIRLAPAGRWLLGLGEQPQASPSFPKTLLVQPNLEILAYRQGLSPALIRRLTHFAAWKTLGAACQLQLEPETVYRALEMGESFESLCRILEQYGTRATPQAVIDSLRTWSNKRDRITIYPNAALIEFASPEDLEQALARGLPGIRITDTLAIVASEDQIDFRQFRLAGTRDYGLPPDRCVLVEDDGVTLTVDLARSDLLLETELPRFAELLARSSLSGTRQYRLTPESLARARKEGLTLNTLENWFQQRAGEVISPAARLLLTAAQLPPPQIRRHLVLHVDSPEIADGLLQWEGTAPLIEEQLGPTTLAVSDENRKPLLLRLAELGLQVNDDAQ
ncbi:MAG: helicase-associated domain-containing protein, partial [Gemmataceae bacterium]